MIALQNRRTLFDFIRRASSLRHPSTTLCCAQDDVILSTSSSSVQAQRSEVEICTGISKVS